MSREVRKVRPDWLHPKYTADNAPHSRAIGWFIPKIDESYKDAASSWLAVANDQGLDVAMAEFGHPPEIEAYMPEWTEAERTHFMMYETTSEGTPISPVMESPEALAKWLADNDANSGAGRTANYEQWLKVCNGARPFGSVMVGGQFISGVEALQ